VEVDSPERLLRNELGWEPDAGAVLNVRAGGRRVRLRPFARRDGWTALLHEVGTRESFPDYRTRRGIARLVEARGHRALIVHAHRVQPLQVWQWIDRSRGRPGQYREQGCLAAAGDEGLRRRLGALPPACDEPTEPAPAAAALNELVAGTLLARLRRRPTLRHGLPTPQARRKRDLVAALQQAIEASDDPAWVRGAWRELRSLALLDPACGRGDRLADALAVLQRLRDACLERMRAWVDELDRARQPHRPERLADFRALLDRASDRRRYRDPDAFLRAAILEENLFGIAADPDHLRRCERRLRAAAGADAGHPPRLNLLQGETAAGIADAAQLRQALGGGPDAPARLLRLTEAAETIHRTRRILREERDGDDGDAASAPASAAAVEARLSALRAELDALAATRGPRTGLGSTDPAPRPAGHRPVHLWAEFFEVMDRGGFDLVLGESVAAAPLRVRERPGSPRPWTPVAAMTGPPATPSRPVVPDVVTRLDPGAPEHTPLRRLLGDRAPATLFLRGNAELLRLPLLAVFCSVRVPGSVILHALDAARALRDRGIPTIGGWQSPLEKEMLAFLLRGRQPVVISPARGIDPMRLPLAWRSALEAGRLLLVSRFEGRLRRPTARLAEQRNLLVAALAERTLIAHAAPGSRTYRLARQLIEWGRPVFTWEDPANAELVRLGAKPVREVGEYVGG
jgi:hypothetical protein